MGITGDNSNYLSFISDNIFKGKNIVVLQGILPMLRSYIDVAHFRVIVSAAKSFPSEDEMAIERVSLKAKEKILELLPLRPGEVVELIDNDCVVPVGKVGDREYVLFHAPADDWHNFLAVLNEAKTVLIDVRHVNRRVVRIRAVELGIEGALKVTEQMKVKACELYMNTGIEGLPETEPYITRNARKARARRAGEAAAFEETDFDD